MEKIDLLSEAMKKVYQESMEDKDSGLTSLGTSNSPLAGLSLSDSKLPESTGLASLVDKEQKLEGLAALDHRRSKEQ